MKTFILFFATLLLFSSCKKDKNEPVIPDPDPTFHSFQGDIGTNDNSTIVSADNNLLICGNSGNNLSILKISKTGSQIWRKDFNAGNGSFASGITQSGNQDVFICGVTWKYGLSSKNDVLLIKTNSSGDTLWTKTYGGSNNDYGYNIITTNDGNLLICGITTTNTFGIYGDIYLLKVNTDGDTIWTKTFPNVDQQAPSHVLQTQNGEYLVTGTKEYNGAGRELHLLKVSNDGALVWNKKIGLLLSEFGYSTVELSTGDLMTCGKIITDSSIQILLVKTNDQGNEYWEKEYGVNYFNEQGNAIRVNTDGTFIITGSYNDSHSGESGIVLLKIDQNGDQLFLKKFGESIISYGQNILKDDSDDNIITGELNGSTIFMTRTDNNGVFK